MSETSLTKADFLADENQIAQIHTEYKADDVGLDYLDDGFGGERPPMIRIAQSTSTVVTAQEIPIGHLYNKKTGCDYGEQIIACFPFMWNFRILWRSDKDGWSCKSWICGKTGIAETENGTQKDCIPEKCEFAKFRTNPHTNETVPPECEYSTNFLTVLPNYCDENGNWEIAQLPMTGTNLRAARQIVRELKKAKKAKRESFMCLFRLGTRSETSKKGSWFKFELKPWEDGRLIHEVAPKYFPWLRELRDKFAEGFQYSLTKPTEIQSTDILVENNTEEDEIPF